MSGYIVKVDGVPEPMQPDTIHWAQPKRLGVAGDGAHIFGPYWACKLGFGRPTTVQYDRWLARWQNGGEYTITLPHPGSGKWQDFTCRVVGFSQRLGTRDPAATAAAGVDIVLGNIEVS